jgi:two-component system OmpR family sensor kinase
MVEGQVDEALTPAETEAASALDSPDGRVHLHAITRDAGRPSLARLDKLVQIVDAGGACSSAARAWGRDAAGTSRPSRPARKRRAGHRDATRSPGEPGRDVSLPIDVDGRYRYAVQVGTRLRVVDAVLDATRVLFLGALLAVLGVVVMIGALLTRSALAPIEGLVAMARRIGESSLDRRLPTRGTNDEVGRLAATLNDMLDRIERGVQTQRRFTADASHELRSPLSRLRAELEIALRRSRTAVEYEEVLRSSLEEVERLSGLTEELLTLARLDAGEGAQAPPAPVLVAGVVAEAVARVAPEARRREVALASEVTPGVVVDVVPGALAMVIENLLSNALKFSPPHGRVTIRTLAAGSEALLSVSDSGPGIPPDEIPRLFGRFFRGRAAQTPGAPGVGLGLAICRAVVEARGGRITVDSRPGAGATFTVHLPLAASAAGHS